MWTQAQILRPGLGISSERYRISDRNRYVRRTRARYVHDSNERARGRNIPHEVRLRHKQTKK